MVEEIEHVQPNLQRGVRSEARVLPDRQIRVVEGGSGDRVPTKIAEAADG
jgi:hypothetical protein